MIEQGDMREVLPRLAEQGIRFDSCVTDPPYHFGSIVKRFAKSGGADRPESRVGAYNRHARGFMGKEWDGGTLAFQLETWRAVASVLKPGSHLLAFGGTRGFHRMACAIEDAGFEIRDTIAWLYGSGFPKSHNLHDEWEGWGTALKPAFEPIIVARMPLAEKNMKANVAAHGVGPLNIDGCRVGEDVRVAAFTSLAPCHGNALGAAGTAAARRGTQGEPKTYVGRWPANVVHDGSEEVLAAFPDSPGQLADLKGHSTARESPNGVFGKFGPAGDSIARRDTGSAARFFYSAKAKASDRAGSNHPTVKPISLMRWLVRLVTPPMGIVLDPFAGSGTTAAACEAEGFDWTLIEREAEYIADIRRRLAA